MKQKCLSLTSLILLSPLSSLNQANYGGPICKVSICVDINHNSNSSFSSSNPSGPTIFSFGHAFISVFSYSSDPLNIGYYTMDYGERITVGLYDSFDESDNIQGIYYNREFFTYSKPEYYPTPENFVSASFLIYSLDPINQISDVIKKRNDRYDGIAYNCVSFVDEVYKIITSKNLIYSIPLPKTIFDQILYSAGFIERTIDPYNVDNFFHYSNGSFVYFDYEPKMNN